MATKWISPTWRMPEESNQSKFENYSLDFGGASADFIDCGAGIGNSIGDNYTGGMAISLWFKADTTASQEKGLFIFEGSTAWGEITAYFYFGKLELRVQGDDKNLDYTFSDTSSFHHLLINFLGPSADNQVYLDGQAIGPTFTYTSGGLDLNGEDLKIGYTYSTSYPFQGKMSDFCVFKNSISTDQISYLYNSGTPQNPMAISGQPPVAYYPLGGSSTGSSSTLTIPNQSVPSATVFNFDGSGSNDEINTNATLSGLGFPATTISESDFSISFWYNATTHVNYAPIIWSSTNYNLNDGFGVAQQLNTTQLRFWVGRYSFNAALTGNLNTGQWYHIAAVFKGGSTYSLQTYVDGVAGSIVTGTTSYNINNSANPVYIGSSGGAHVVSYPFDGKLSNVQIWNAELGTSDVTTLYNNGVPLFSGTQPEAANLKAWYKLNVDTSTWDGSDWSITDSSGEGNTGTSSGMTTANLVTSDLTRSIPYSSYSMDFEELSSQNINIGSSTLFDSTSPFSFSTWCKLESYDNSFPAFVRLKTDQSTGFIMGFSNYNATYYGVWFGSSSNFLTAKTAGNISADLLGVWKHISLVYDGVDRTAISSYSLYINGVVQSLVGAGSFGATPNTNVIGQGNTALTFWDGLLSNVSVFNTTLTEDQIITIYNGGVPNDISSLSPASWWSLAGDSYYDGTNWICPDLGSGGNNGTSANMAGTELVGNGPGSTANGIATSMDIPANLKGNAPNSSKNAFSINMNSADRLSGITNTPGTDSDVSSFLSAASITNTTQQTAINNLVLGLKNYGIWDKMKIIYPFVGSTDTSHSYNLKDTRVAQITWSTGVTHTSDGAKGAASGTGYGDTGVTPSTLGLGRDDTSLGVYTQEGWVNNQQMPLGIFAGNTSLSIYKAGGVPGTLFPMIHDYLGPSFTAPSPLTGFHQLSRTQSTEVSYKKDNSTVQNISSVSAANPSTTRNLWVLAANGYTNYGYAATTSLIYFGLGLTDSELGEMNTLITAYQTELGRQV